MKKIFTILFIVLGSVAMLYAGAGDLDLINNTFEFTLEYNVVDSAIVSFTTEPLTVTIDTFRDNPTLPLEFANPGSAPDSSAKKLTANSTNNGFKLAPFHVNYLLRSAKSAVTVSLTGSALKNSDNVYMGYSVAISQNPSTIGTLVDNTLTYSAGSADLPTTITLTNVVPTAENGYISWGSYKCLITTGTIPGTAVAGKNFTATLTVGVNAQ